MYIIDTFFPLFMGFLAIQMCIYLDRKSLLLGEATDIILDIVHLAHKSGVSKGFSNYNAYYDVTVHVTS